MVTLELEIEDLSVLPALKEMLSKFSGVALKPLKEKSIDELRKSKNASDKKEYLKRVMTMDDDEQWKELELLSNDLPDCPLTEEEIVAEVKKVGMKK